MSGPVCVIRKFYIHHKVLKRKSFIMFILQKEAMLPMFGRAAAGLLMLSVECIDD